MLGYLAVALGKGVRASPGVPELPGETGPGGKEELGAGRGSPGLPSCLFGPEDTSGQVP